jgi:TP901 family phage tail tape measure protein
LDLKTRTFGSYVIVSSAIIKLSQSISNATRDAIKFEAELGRIAQTNDIAVKSLRGLTKELLQVSEEYGVSATKIAETVRVLTQAGVSFRDAADAAKSLAKTTLLASFEDYESTLEGTIAAMKQFEITGRNVEGLLNSINQVSKKYAVESSDLTEVIKRAGGVFAATGGSVEELFSLFTSVRGVTRESTETIATGLRTIFTRLQRPSTIKYFKELGIELTDLNKNFIGNFEAIQRISAGLERAGIAAGSLKFAEVVEEIGGIRQQSRVIPLLQQTTTQLEALNVAKESGNSIDKDVAVQQKTLEFRVRQLGKEFSSLFIQISQSDSFQTIAKFLIEASRAALKLVDALGQIQPLLLAFGGFQAGRFAKRFISGPKNPFGFAKGGRVPGIGNKDSELAMVMPGEFIIPKNKAIEEGYGNLERKYLKGYAKGGAVGIGNSPEEDVRNRLSQRGTPLSQSEAESAFRDFIKVFPQFTEQLEKIVVKVENIPTQTTNAGPNIKPRGLFKTKKISIDEKIGDLPTLRHEGAHAVDNALAGGGRKLNKETRKYQPNLASKMEGTFQNELVKSIKPNIEKAFGDVGKADYAKTATLYEELFAELLSRSTPEVQKIIASTTDAATGWAALAEQVQKTGERLYGDLQQDQRLSAKVKEVITETASAPKKVVSQAKSDFKASRGGKDYDNSVIDDIINSKLKQSLSPKTAEKIIPKAKEDFRPASDEDTTEDRIQRAKEALKKADKVSQEALNETIKAASKQSDTSTVKGGSLRDRLKNRTPAKAVQETIASLPFVRPEGEYGPPRPSKSVQQQERKYSLVYDGKTTTMIPQEMEPESKFATVGNVRPKTPASIPPKPPTPPIVASGSGEEPKKSRGGLFFNENLKIGPAPNEEIIRLEKEANQAKKRLQEFQARQKTVKSTNTIGTIKKQGAASRPRLDEDGIQNILQQASFSPGRKPIRPGDNPIFKLFAPNASKSAVLGNVRLKSPKGELAAKAKEDCINICPESLSRLGGAKKCDCDGKSPSTKAEKSQEQEVQDTSIGLSALLGAASAATIGLSTLTKVFGDSTSEMSKQIEAFSTQLVKNSVVVAGAASVGGAVGKNIAGAVGGLFSGKDSESIKTSAKDLAKGSAIFVGAALTVYKTFLDAQNQLKTDEASKAKELAIKEGDVKGATKAATEEANLVDEASRSNIASSVAAGIGGVLGGLLTPILGPIAPEIGAALGNFLGQFKTIQESIISFIDAGITATNYLIEYIGGDPFPTLTESFNKARETAIIEAKSKAIFAKAVKDFDNATSEFSTTADFGNAVGGNAGIDIRQRGVDKFVNKLSEILKTQLPENASEEDKKNLEDQQKEILSKSQDAISEQAKIFAQQGKTSAESLKKLGAEFDANGKILGSSKGIVGDYIAGLKAVGTTQDKVDEAMEALSASVIQATQSVEGLADETEKLVGLITRRAKADSDVRAIENERVRSGNNTAITFGEARRNSLNIPDNVNNLKATSAIRASAFEIDNNRSTQESKAGLTVADQQFEEQKSLIQEQIAAREVEIDVIKRTSDQYYSFLDTLTFGTNQEKRQQEGNLKLAQQAAKNGVGSIAPSKRRDVERTLDQFADLPIFNGKTGSQVKTEANVATQERIIGRKLTDEEKANVAKRSVSPQQAIANEIANLKTALLEADRTQITAEYEAMKANNEAFKSAVTLFDTAVKPFAVQLEELNKKKALQNLEKVNIKIGAEQTRKEDADKAAVEQGRARLQTELEAAKTPKARQAVIDKLGANVSQDDFFKTQVIDKGLLKGATARKADQEGFNKALLSQFDNAPGKSNFMPAFNKDEFKQREATMRKLQEEKTKAVGEVRVANGKVEAVVEPINVIVTMPNMGDMTAVIMTDVWNKIQQESQKRKEESEMGIK